MITTILVYGYKCTIPYYLVLIVNNNKNLQDLNIMTSDIKTPMKTRRLILNTNILIASIMKKTRLTYSWKVVYEK